MQHCGGHQRYEYAVLGWEADDAAPQPPAKFRHHGCGAILMRISALQVLSLDKVAP